MGAFDWLANAPRWVAWQEEPREGGKVTKVPYSPHGGRAKADEPSTWGTRAQAADTAARLPQPTGVGGPGIELGDLGDGTAIGGLDLDTCRDPATGAIEPWAMDLINRLNSYTEVSPSGTGAKVFFRYDPAALPELIRMMQTAGGKKWQPTRGEHAPAIELYLTGRYFTVTGQRLPRSPEDIRPVPRAVLERVVTVDGPAFAKRDPGPPPASAPSTSADLLASDDAVWQRVQMQAWAHQPLDRLLQGKFDHLQDSSRSGLAMAMGSALRTLGFSYDEMCAALRTWSHTAAWYFEKGEINGERELHRIWDRVAAEKPAPVAAVVAPGEPSRLRLLSPDDCADSPGRPYVIKGFLAERDVGCVFGAPGAGKSILAPHLGYAVAQGRTAFGRRTRPGKVFYVAAEDSHGMRQRVRALRLQHGGADSFYVVEGLGSLLAPAEASALSDLIAKHQPSLIIIDTVAMAWPGIDENTSQDMGLVVAGARRFTEHGAAVLLIHHSTKESNGTPRGHSILNGALDVSLELAKADEGGIIRGELRKNRNGSCEIDLALRINAVELGTDEDGDAITAPVAQEVTNRGAFGDREAVEG